MHQIPTRPLPLTIFKIKVDSKIDYHLDRMFSKQFNNSDKRAQVAQWSGKPWKLWESQGINLVVSEILEMPGNFIKISWEVKEIIVRPWRVLLTFYLFCIMVNPKDSIRWCHLSSFTPYH